MDTIHKLGISVDIEDWYHIPSVCGSPFSVYKDTDDFFKHWNERYDYLSKPTQVVLDLLQQYGIKATFFVVGEVVKHYPNLIESIVEHGHEIACHGLHHECKIDSKTKQPLIDQQVFEEYTLSAKEMLEEASGQKIVGYRAPNALIAGWMIDNLERLGFSYDSSVSMNSIYNKTDSSLHGVQSYPYYPELHGLRASPVKRNIIELPFAYWNLGMKIPTSGGPMLRFLGKRVILNGLKQSIKRGPTVFYFHSIDISSESFPSIGNRRPFYWLIKGETVRRRIEFIFKKLSNVPKATLSDIACDYKGI